MTSAPQPEQVMLARARLAEAAGLEPAEQVALFDDVHQLLQQALEELDAAASAADGTTGGGPATP